MVPTDYTKSQQQIITDLINADNGTMLTVDMLTFGYPTAIPGWGNTQVVVTASTGSPYSNSVVFNYNRIDLSTVPGARNIVFDVGSAVNISDLIPAINAAYQINLTPGQFIDGPLPQFTNNTPGTTIPFTVVADPSSLVFIGRVTLQLARAKIPLSTIITVTALNGLVYIQPAP